MVRNSEFETESVVDRQSLIETRNSGSFAQMDRSCGIDLKQALFVGNTDHPVGVLAGQETHYSLTVDPDAGPT